MPFQILELLEALTQVDPIRSYAQRGVEALTRFTQARHGSLDACDGNVRETLERRDGRVRLAIPVRVGRRTLGLLRLDIGAGDGKLAAHDLRLVRFGVRVFSRQLDYAHRLAPPSGGSRLPTPFREALRRAPLTPRERDVVALLVGGASTREISRRTGLTIATVHTYLKRVYPKLGVHSRVELVAHLAGTRGRAPRNS